MCKVDAREGVTDNQVSTIRKNSNAYKREETCFQDILGSERPHPMQEQNCKRLTHFI